MLSVVAIYRILAVAALPHFRFFYVAAIVILRKGTFGSVHTCLFRLHRSYQANRCIGDLASTKGYKHAISTAQRETTLAWKHESRRLERAYGAPSFVAVPLSQTSHAQRCPSIYLWDAPRIALEKNTVRAICKCSWPIECPALSSQRTAQCLVIPTQAWYQIPDSEWMPGNDKMQSLSSPAGTQTRASFDCATTKACLR